MRKTVVFFTLITSFYTFFSTAIIFAEQAGPSINYEQITARPHLYLSVKYRSTPVDVANPKFQFLDTSRSSFVTGAWYDKKNSYMIIGLKGTYYHYCNMPNNAWESFCSAESFGKHYNRFIKGRHDCRFGGVPDY